MEEKEVGRGGLGREEEYLLQMQIFVLAGFRGGGGGGTREVDTIEEVEGGGRESTG